MQGFVGQRAFTVDNQPYKPSVAVIHEEDTSGVIEAHKREIKLDSSFVITLISRRSIKRPGLRCVRFVVISYHIRRRLEPQEILQEQKSPFVPEIYLIAQVLG